MRVQYKLVGRVHTFTWPTKPVDHKLANRAREMFAGTRTFNLDSPRANEAVIAAGFETGLSRGLLESIYLLTLRQKALTNNSRIRAKIARIEKQYSAGVDILELSNIYDYPPILLMRRILEYQGMAQSAIKQLLANPAANEQLARAIANDSESTATNNLCASIALELELKFVSYFRDLGIALETENDIRAKGSPGSTPDIHFLEPVMINGTRISWIDFKNYYGAEWSFLTHHNKLQVSKTTAKYGKGAICYNPAFSDTLTLDALILDTLALDIYD